MRQIHKLTARQVATISTPGWHGDGGGLYLRISDDGRRRWVFVFIRNGKRREMGFGASAGANAVSLAKARERAIESRAMLRAATDPLDAAQAQQCAQVATKQSSAKEASIPSFGMFADEYVETMRSSWRNPKHAAQWTMTLTRYCAPIRDNRIDTIGTPEVLEILKTHWTERPETAQRLRGRIENVLDAAKARGWRNGENPARWRGHLDNLLPARQKLTRGHHAALPFEEMHKFMTALKSRNAVAARLLEFTVLTATRTSEAIGAQLSEFNLDKAEWTIPAHRMKTGIAHRVPLSKGALSIVTNQSKALPGAFVFPGRGKAPLSNMAMSQMLKRMGRADITVHGFRSSFRDWAAETSTFPHEVCEMALAHTIANKAEAAYRRGDLFEKRRSLMVAWDLFCSRPFENTVQLGQVHAA